MKRLYTLLLALLLFCGSFCTSAQQLLWQRYYPHPDSNRYLIYQQIDTTYRGFVAGGIKMISTPPQQLFFRGFFTVFNRQGDTLFTRFAPDSTLFEDHDVRQLPDSGYVFSCSVMDSARDTQTDIYLARYDSLGSLLWQKQVDLGGQEWPAALQPLPNGDILLTAYSGLLTSAGDFMLLRFDSAGNLLWQKRYGGSNFEYVSMTLPTTRGTFIMAGNSSSFLPQFSLPLYQTYLLETDHKGDSLRSQQITFGFNPPYYIEALNRWHNNLIETRSGEYVYTARLDSNQSPIRTLLGQVVKLDAQLNVLWHRELRPQPGQQSMILAKVRELEDSTLLVLGTPIMSGPVRAFHLFRFSPTGQQLPTYTFTTSCSSNLWLYDYEFYQPDSSIIIMGYCDKQGYAAKVGPIGRPAVVVGTPPVAAPAAVTPWIGYAYPNPGSSTVRIPYELAPGTSTARLQLFCLVTGRVLREQAISGSGEVQLELSDLPVGMYGYGLLLEGQLRQVQKLSVVR